MKMLKLRPGPSPHGMRLDIGLLNLRPGLDNPCKPVQYLRWNWIIHAQTWPIPLTGLTPKLIKKKDKLRLKAIFSSAHLLPFPRIICPQWPSPMPLVPTLYRSSLKIYL